MRKSSIANCRETVYGLYLDCHDISCLFMLHLAHLATCSTSNLFNGLQIINSKTKALMDIQKHCTCKLYKKIPLHGINVCCILHIIVQFHPWFVFFSPLFLGMVMHDNEFKTRGNTIISTKDKIQPPNIYFQCSCLRKIN